jgi:ubiquitin-like domain-containing CTD phosphatase 1
MTIDAEIESMSDVAVTTTSSQLLAPFEEVETQQQPTNNNNYDDDEEATTPTATLLPTVTLIAKYGKERITLSNLPGSTTIGEIKSMIQQTTRILPVRQKLVGLSAKCGGTKGVTDALPISELQPPKSSSSASGRTGNHDDHNNSSSATTASASIVHQFILMGTPEEQIFIDPCHKNDLPEILDDFDFDFHAGSEEWVQHCANETKLKQFTKQTPIHIMNEPRPNKPLLVLDLDHTLLDFSSKSILLQQQQQLVDDSTTAAVIHPTSLTTSMKRPYMDEFLSQCYIHFDMVIWSQTSWRWLETKLIELNMISHPGYKFCFVLDKVR